MLRDVERFEGVGSLVWCSAIGGVVKSGAPRE